MNNALHKKLRIKENMRVGTVTKPVRFIGSLKPLPQGCTLSHSFSSKDDVILWFVKSSEELIAGEEEVLSNLTDQNIIWIGYPKRTGGIKTDLSRDNGWDSLMKRNDISFVSYISFNEIWSTFCIRKKTATDKKKESKTTIREIFKYADSKTKTILIPEDLALILSKNKKAQTIFDALSFSNRREYVEWVITAKRVETRKMRIESLLEKLIKTLKNPKGR